MASRLPQFTEPQWAFLAVLDALEEPVHIEVVGTLAPLLPGPLFDLLKRADEYNIIRKHDADVFGLGPNIPHGVHRKLKEMNTSAGLAALGDRLKDARLVDENGVSGDFGMNGPKKDWEMSGSKKDMAAFDAKLRRKREEEAFEIDADARLRYYPEVAREYCHEVFRKRVAPLDPFVSDKAVV